MIANYHRELLELIRAQATADAHPMMTDSYLGTDHPRYAISAAALRAIARNWMGNHTGLTAGQLAALLDKLVQGASATEKILAGILMDYAPARQLAFDPSHFDRWLDHLEGWAEVDAVCTNKYTKTQLVSNWPVWQKQLIKFSKSDNIHKQRASLVLLCTPLRHSDDQRLADAALRNVEKLKHEKEVLVTKAISWVLRSMVKHHRLRLQEYLQQHGETLPKIAVRETLMKLKTGKKTK